MDEKMKKIEEYKRVNQFAGKIAQTRLHGLTRLLSKTLAGITLSKNKAEPKDNAGDLAREWQRMMGLDDYFKVAKLEGDTAYCEIHFDCILAKTGNAEACNRLMEYDRTILNRIGGELEIVKSRVDPAVKNCCTIAIRKKRN